ncbi:hypothetical protein IMAU10149_01852 [Lactobacillus helveticus]|uniref:AbiH family protein n=2 Tax=Lactobacillus helveticus TaxID=1587 RepID=UPI00156735BE|nr:AbiH family protein [Lactobacillus helveticus]NRO85260.1 hypothetical protein [Lactobacillus helveticus]
MEYSDYLDAYRNHNSSVEKFLVSKNDTSLEINQQHNIMVLVGNGFDIDLLQRYGTQKIDGRNVLTIYQDFFKECMLAMGKDENKDNEVILDFVNSIFFKELKKRYKNRDKNWADFESWLPEITNNYTIKELSDGLNSLQSCFSFFLDFVVNRDVKHIINQIAQQRKTNLAIRSLSCFLKDLSEEEYKTLFFPRTTAYKDIFNYLFVNFNFTNLLDNYIYLDKNAFDIHRDKYDIRNFQFYPNPKSCPTIYKGRTNTKWINESTSWSSILHTRVIHPHGQQSIPRSLLFGADDESLEKNRRESRFDKEYWTRYSIEYEKLFSQTQLFIIYGSSIGESDKWWWKEICSRLAKNYGSYPSAELIVYSYRKKFDKNAFVKKYVKDSKERIRVSNRIHVREYNNSDQNVFLSFKS